MTVGTATLSDDGSQWFVQCAPHVAIRIKHLFPRAGKQRAGAIVVAATEEVSRDLEWFAQRHPLEFVREDGSSAEEELEARARAFDARMELAAEIATGKYVPPAVEMALPPREYQAQAAYLAYRGRSLLLADSVGLGKTVSALALLAHEGTLPAAIVCEAHLTAQWRREVRRFLPRLRVHVAQKSTPPGSEIDPRRMIPGLKLPALESDVYVLSYHKLWGWSDLLASIVKTVVFDECQALRRKESKRYEGALQVAEATTFRMGLSATPIYNYGYEFHSVLEVVAPGALGAEDEFLREWCVGGYMEKRKAKVKDPKAFGAYLRESGLMLRRTRADVARELPELSKVIHEVESDPEKLKEIEGDAVELARVILSSAPRFERMKAGGEFDMRLRQATGISKAPYVADFVRMLLEDGDDSVVLFGWHRAVYDVWMERLEEFRPALYTGSESASRKDGEKQRFLDGDTRLLIMSLRSGAGVDGLQRVASTVVFGELDWSPGAMEQCAGRVHRDGQASPVIAYYLTANEGCDPPMMDVLGIKRAQIEGVRAPDADTVSAEADPNHVRAMAEAFLKRRGVRA